MPGLLSRHFKKGSSHIASAQPILTEERREAHRVCLTYSALSSDRRTRYTLRVQSSIPFSPARARTRRI